MAGYALESDAPDGFTTAMVARDVLMLDVLIHIVGQLEEGGFVFVEDATMAEVVVRLLPGFVSRLA